MRRTLSDGQRNPTDRGPYSRIERPCHDGAVGILLKRIQRGERTTPFLHGIEDSAEVIANSDNAAAPRARRTSNCARPRQLFLVCFARHQNGHAVRRCAQTTSSRSRRTLDSLPPCSIAPSVRRFRANQRSLPPVHPPEGAMPSGDAPRRVANRSLLNQLPVVCPRRYTSCIQSHDRSDGRRSSPLRNLGFRRGCIHVGTETSASLQSASTTSTGIIAVFPLSAPERAASCQRLPEMLAKLKPSLMRSTNRTALAMGATISAGCRLLWLPAHPFAPPVQSALDATRL